MFAHFAHAWLAYNRFFRFGVCFGVCLGGLGGLHGALVALLNRQLCVG